MNETTKTLVFVGVAAVSLVAAAMSSRSTSDFDIQSRVGDVIQEFSPEDAKRLKIVEFNEDTATLSDFEVVQNDEGIWSLTSKNGYPADAERQMGEAAGSLLDRQILAVVSESAVDHEQFGVVDPTSPKLEVGQKGVGRRVTLSDINDEALIDLIVGKKVRGQEGQHYVREANRDFVYVIEIDPEQLSTDFSDWIESDLLQLNSWDVQQVAIKDYSFEIVRVNLLEARPDWERRGEYTLRYDDTEAEWQVVSLKKFDEQANQFVDAPLAGNEELDSAKLNELKRALDDLSIVDVEKKPGGLTANLKAGEGFVADQEGLESLFNRGFTTVRGEDDQPDLLSSEGEATVTLKNGVEYVLRFGDLQVSSESGERKESDEESEEAEEPSQGSKVNRYLFVMVRMNEEAVEKPELEDLPELPSDAEQTDASRDDNSEAEDNASAEAETPQEAGESEVTEETDDTEESAAANEAEAIEESDDDELAQTIERRKEIEQENQRKLDEYQKKLDEGRKKVEELNVRFGDWYYVISNDTFQKIRLSRDEIVKEKEPDDKTAESEEAATSEFGPAGGAIPGVPDLPTTEDEGEDTADIEESTDETDVPEADVVEQSSDNGSDE